MTPSLSHDSWARKSFSLKYSKLLVWHCRLFFPFFLKEERYNYRGKPIADKNSLYFEIYVLERDVSEGSVSLKSPQRDFFSPTDSTAGGPPGARGSIRVQYPVASVDREGNVSGGEMFIGGHGDWRVGPLPVHLSKAASPSLSPTVSLQQELSPSHPSWFLLLLASALENSWLTVRKPNQCFPRPPVPLYNPTLQGGLHPLLCKLHPSWVHLRFSLLHKRLSWCSQWDESLEMTPMEAGGNRWAGGLCLRVLDTPSAIQWSHQHLTYHRDWQTFCKGPEVDILSFVNQVVSAIAAQLYSGGQKQLRWQVMNVSPNFIYGHWNLNFA